MLSENERVVASKDVDDEAICVENISKSYRIYPNNRGRLRQIFFPRNKYYEEFWALKDISFSVMRGEALGVIGLNGAGKSTLLQIIIGILKPTTGTRRLKGNVAALVELGMGFNPQFTGMENVYMNGSILGFSRGRIEQKMGEIRAFADIGEFFDRPVRMYSKGMKVRLGFAVAVTTEPDILVVDEVLSVGDFRFQQKCLEKIQQMRENMSVIFVSHSMAHISRFCNEVAVLDKGRIIYTGEPDDAISLYMETILGEKGQEDKQQISHKAFQGELFHDEDKITDIKHQWVGKNGDLIESTEHRGEMFLEFSFRLLTPARNLVIGVPTWDSAGNMITAFNTDARNVAITPSGDGLVKGRLRLDPIIFNPGDYSSVMAIVDGPQFLYRKRNNDFRIKAVPMCYGFVTPDHEWEFG